MARTVAKQGGGSFMLQRNSLAAGARSLGNVEGKMEQHIADVVLAQPPDNRKVPVKICCFSLWSLHILMLRVFSGCSDLLS